MNPALQASGIAAGTLAGALWGLTFVAPRLVEPFSPFDLAVLRNIIFGIVSALLLATPFASLRGLDRSGLLIALALGLMGYAAYYILIAYAVVFAGPAIPALVVGALPVLLSLYGNRRERVVAARSLAVPLLLVASGLAIVNAGALAAPQGGRTAAGVLFGLLLSLGALLLWFWYAILNADALRRRPGTDTFGWTSLQGIGAALGLLPLLPLGLAAGWSRLPELDPFGPAAAGLWLWAFLTGALSSWLATLAWVAASRRLSVALSAQLIVTETLFGLTYGFILEARLPGPHEWAGALLLIVGVMRGVRLLSPRGPPAPG